MAGCARGHDVKAFGLCKGKVASHECVLQFRRRLLDDVATVAAGTGQLNQLDVESLAQRLNAILHFVSTGSSHVSGVVCNLRHDATSESLVNFVEQADHLVVVLYPAVEHLRNATETGWWHQEGLQPTNGWPTVSGEGEGHSS